ncbi:GNAT family N-acetyltransferase [Amycolatopsis jiangsuensis]|uniref:RimJ/RimL family protein N-acetyltransferase n=1 Tax=Amycolatopsis jiangsuensis TaxID=1181879 RepID=A0A840IPU7_9PSEU|nr:GNAT family N-acetyltransferase [Amycolatopsis jiangsuensis]MBB4683579.1 RimJ/RimL family protein N-acetyltransferase [Amycolatopsis jiangsuensis]
MALRDTVLATARLRLTTWSPSDLDDLAALHADPEAMRHLRTGPQTRSATAKRLGVFIAEHERRGWSKWRVETTDGEFVGRAGFGTAHGTGHRELGYLLARPAWGAGFATELAQALKDWHEAHPSPGVAPPLRGYVYPANVASRRVLEKAGFRLLRDQDGELVYETGCGS